jgi:hypothetical protein
MGRGIRKQENRMSILLALGILAAPLGLEPGLNVEHRVRIDHGAGPVEAHYRTQVNIRHKQVGTMTKPGTPSTLRCAWRADVRVMREARHGSGSVLARTHDSQTVLSGTRPGGCNTSRDSIAREVATRGEALRAHLIEVAERDRGVLHAELDRLLAANQG